MVRSIRAYKASSGSLGRTNRCWESVFVLRRMIVCQWMHLHISSTTVACFWLVHLEKPIQWIDTTHSDQPIGRVIDSIRNAWHSIWRPTTLQNDWTWLNMLTICRYTVPQREHLYTKSDTRKGMGSEHSRHVATSRQGLKPVRCPKL